MTAYEYVRSVFFYELERAEIISARIASDMGHKNLHSLAFKETVHRMNEAQAVIIAVAGHPYERLEGGYFLGKIHPTAEIPGVPDLIDRLKEFPELPVKYTVSVRYKPYKHFS